MRETVAVDVDGVIANFMEPFTKLCEIHKIKLDFNTYDTVYGCTKEQIKTADRIVDFILSNQCLIKAYPNSYLGLAELAEYFNLLFLTARKIKFRSRTISWFDKFIEFSIAYNLIIGVKSRNKVQYLLDNNIKILVEDRLRTANEAAEKGIKTFLMKRPWNSNREVHEDIIVIRSLMDILKYTN